MMNTTDIGQCTFCDAPNSACDMVQCDSCDQWAHYTCAGVTESVKNSDWICKKCSGELRVPRTKKTSKKTSNQKSKSEGGSVHEGISEFDVELKKLEDEQRLREKALEEEMVLKEKRMEMERKLKEMRIMKEKEFKQKQLAEEREMRKRQLQEEQKMLDQQLEEEAAFLKERKRMHSEFQKAKELIGRGHFQAKNPVEKQEKEMPFDKKVEFWMHKQGETSRGHVSRDPRFLCEKLPSSASRKTHQGAGEVYGETEEETSSEDFEEKSSEEENELEEEAEADEEPDEVSVSESSVYRTKQAGMRKKLSNKPKKIRKTIKTPTKLSPEQIAARQAISKSLPVFKGEPELWPIFISSFEFTTEACGFSNLDNLKRLQDCLQGNALEAVRSRLVLPDSVPDVIKDLRRLFGKPEKLLKTLLAKVQNSPAPRSDRLETFIQFGLTVKQLCDHLEAAKLKEHLYNPMLVQELVGKLPPNYRLDWVRFKRGKKAAPLRMFTDFMNDIVSDVSEISDFGALSLGEPSSSPSNRSKPNRKEFVHIHNATSNKSYEPANTKDLKPCLVCERTDHKLRFCDDLKKMNIVERLKVVDQYKLCTLCLNNHGKSRCTFKLQCNVGGCQGNHHPLLHRVEEAVQLSKVECNSHSQRNRNVIFRIIPVTISSESNELDTVAFFDEGSSGTLIEESLVKQLNVEGTFEPLEVTWTGNIKRYGNRSQRVNLKLSARGSNHLIPLMNVRTVEELKLPKQSMQQQEISDRYPHLRDVPVLSYDFAEPGLIIGLDNLHVFALLESRVGQIGEPIAVRTRAGWMVYGPETQTITADIRLNVHSYEKITNEGLHDLLRDQYVLEELNIDPALIPQSSADQRASEILKTTTRRIGNRFETGLLWRNDVQRFPDNFSMAMRRLKALERKLENNPGLHRNVHRLVSDYVEKGYAHKATDEELAEMNRSKTWYLPLNVVLNPRKPEKVRLVWDAAATVNGVSLNSELLSGPDMLQPLPTILYNFRERRIAFGGDIQEMYHQILIRQQDKSAQLFLFRSKSTEPPEVYIMDVATFGATCSPCSAQFIKNLNAAEFREQFPKAADAIVHKHYVDDYYDSVDSEEQAIKMAKEVKYIHSCGGFNIRNWVSNSPQFLQALGDSSQDSTVHFNRDKISMNERVLGIIWDPKEDVICFSTTMREEYQAVLRGTERPTKRIVLSCVMSMFDPLGLLTPFTMFGRILVQDLWRTGCEWDERLDDESFEKWMRWVKVLPLIANIKVPRSYFGDAKFDNIKNVQLHVLTDASKGAYGCVAYFRAIVDGEIQCVLVASRVKVAPLKPTSVPRLELQAAVLGARLASIVRKNHSFDISQQFFWTDSSTVLSWIRSDQRRYKEYVGFRIGEILTLSRLAEWHWVPTKLNVADQLTKWTGDSDITSTAVWFQGPDFMYQEEKYWPKPKILRAETNEDIKTHLLIHDITLPETLIEFHRISKWTVLVRTVATVFRFISNCKRKANRQPIETLKPTAIQKKLVMPMTCEVIRVPLKQCELEKAEHVLVRMAQAETFAPELKILRRNAELPTDKWLPIEKSSILYKLTPLIDDEGVIRSEGRSERANFLPFDLRFPIILPKEHCITNKIVQHFHENFGHSYRETVKNELRQRFLIPKVSAVIAKVAKSCMVCKVRRNHPKIPRMASLPVQRITPYQRPFSFVGVDYFGPITVTIGRRSEKRWIVIFTCLVVRAVHLEVAHSLTTQSCLMAIRRFICCRGPPTEFFSDNGTNLKAASKELASCIRDIDEDCANEITSARTKWTFNPPASPHMGGVWERLVRSVKDVMQVLDDGRRLTDEVLMTTVAEAADIINARPLVYTSQAMEEALTPNHFLRGVSPNEPCQTTSPVNPAKALRDSYQRSQQLTEDMWQRWIREYVPFVNKRTKWFNETKNLKVGDLMYVVEGGKRKCWIRGVIEEPITSEDGRVRQAWVRTNSGRFKRATANLAVLEIYGDTEPEVASGSGHGLGLVVNNSSGCTARPSTEERENSIDVSPKRKE